MSFFSLKREREREDALSDLQCKFSCGLQKYKKSLNAQRRDHILCSLFLPPLSSVISRRGFLHCLMATVLKFICSKNLLNGLKFMVGKNIIKGHTGMLACDYHLASKFRQNVILNTRNVLSE